MIHGMSRIFFVPLILLISIKTVNGQSSPAKYAGQFNLKKGVAIQGFDPVSYYMNDKPLEGKKTISLTYNSAVYFFSSEKNLEIFKKNPSKYEPAYGGWCAYAMGAKGEKVEIDPETFKIINGKIYLFYNRFLTNTLPLWNKDEASLKPKADRNWQHYMK
jgi:YHS domain-containing protein